MNGRTTVPRVVAAVGAISGSSAGHGNQHHRDGLAVTQPSRARWWEKHGFAVATATLGWLGVRAGFRMRLLVHPNRIVVVDLVSRHDPGWPHRSSDVDWGVFGAMLGLFGTAMLVRRLLGNGG
ncbi:hypothetical protein ACWDV4_24235 [Micromonospora sp. NPDC003197]